MQNSQPPTPTPDKPTCRYCNKQFRTQDIKVKHELEQACRKPADRTYCKSCNFTGQNRTEFNDHLMSIAHLNQVCGIQVTPVKIESKTVFDYDPYLTSEEAGKIKKTTANVGNEFKIHFRDNSMQRLDTQPAIKQPSVDPVTAKIAAYEKANNSAPNVSTNYQAILQQQTAAPGPTEKQLRILAWLAKWDGESEIDKTAKIRLILEKITPVEADGLCNHIRNYSGMSLATRQVYCGYIDTLVNVLIGFINKGIKTFGDKHIDIFEFVTKLTK